MRLSLQTVSIVLGVTLVHLFVIAAFSPAQSEWTGPLPKIEIDPALESLLEEAITELTGVPEAGGEENRGLLPYPMPPSPATAAEGESSPVKMTDLRADLSTEEKANDATAALPVRNLAEIEESKTVKAGSDEPAALRQPPRQIREIRNLQPIPRS